MPAVPAPAKILVTGASGFLGVYVVKSLIERGYIVRGTVRTTGRGEYLKKLFPEHFEYVIVPDMESVREKTIISNFFLTDPGGV